MPCKSEAFLIYYIIIYLPLLCGRPEVLQGDYSFGILQSYVNAQQV